MNAFCASCGEAKERSLYSPQLEDLEVLGLAKPAPSNPPIRTHTLSRPSPAFSASCYKPERSVTTDVHYSRTSIQNVQVENKIIFIIGQCWKLLNETVSTVSPLQDVVNYKKVINHKKKFFEFLKILNADIKVNLYLKK